MSAVSPESATARPKASPAAASPAVSLSSGAQVASVRAKTYAEPVLVSPSSSPYAPTNTVSPRPRGSSQVVRPGTIGRREFGLLGPGATRANEDIGNARGGTRVVICVRTDQCSITRQGNAIAELVALRRISGLDLGLLGPDAARPGKHNAEPDIEPSSSSPVAPTSAVSPTPPPRSRSSHTLPHRWA